MKVKFFISLVCLFFAPLVKINAEVESSPPIYIIDASEPQNAFINLRAGLRSDNFNNIFYVYLQEGEQIEVWNKQESGTSASNPRLEFYDTSDPLETSLGEIVLSSRRSYTYNAKFVAPKTSVYKMIYKTENNNSSRPVSMLFPVVDKEGNLLVNPFGRVWAKQLYVNDSNGTAGNKIDIDYRIENKFGGSYEFSVIGLSSAFTNFFFTTSGNLGNACQMSLMASVDGDDPVLGKCAGFASDDYANVFIAEPDPILKSLEFDYIGNDNINDFIYVDDTIAALEIMSVKEVYQDGILLRDTFDIEYKMNNTVEDMILLFDFDLDQNFGEYEWIDLNLNEQNDPGEEQDTDLDGIFGENERQFFKQSQATEISPNLYSYRFKSNLPIPPDFEFTVGLEVENYGISHLVLADANVVEDVNVVNIDTGSDIIYYNESYKFNQINQEVSQNETCLLSEDIVNNLNTSDLGISTNGTIFGWKQARCVGLKSRSSYGASSLIDLWTKNPEPIFDFADLDNKTTASDNTFAIELSKTQDTIVQSKQLSYQIKVDEKSGLPDFKNTVTIKNIFEQEILNNYIDVSSSSVKINQESTVRSSINPNLSFKDLSLDGLSFDFIKNDILILDVALEFKRDAPVGVYEEFVNTAKIEVKNAAGSEYCTLSNGQFNIYNDDCIAQNKSDLEVLELAEIDLKINSQLSEYTAGQKVQYTYELTNKSTQKADIILQNLLEDSEFSYLSDLKVSVDDALIDTDLLKTGLELELQAKEVKNITLSGYINQDLFRSDPLSDGIVNNKVSIKYKDKPNFVCNEIENNPDCSSSTSFSYNKNYDQITGENFITLEKNATIMDEVLNDNKLQVAESVEFQIQLNSTSKVASRVRINDLGISDNELLDISPSSEVTIDYSDGNAKVIEFSKISQPLGFLIDVNPQGTTTLTYSATFKKPQINNGVITSAVFETSPGYTTCEGKNVPNSCAKSQIEYEVAQVQARLSAEKKSINSGELNTYTLEIKNDTQVPGNIKVTDLFADNEFAGSDITDFRIDGVENMGNITDIVELTIPAKSIKTISYDVNFGFPTKNIDNIAQSQIMISSNDTLITSQASCGAQVCLDVEFNTPASFDGSIKTDVQKAANGDIVNYTIELLNTSVYPATINLVGDFSDLEFSQSVVSKASIVGSNQVIGDIRDGLELEFVGNQAISINFSVQFASKYNSSSDDFAKLGVTIFDENLETKYLQLENKLDFYQKFAELSLNLSVENSGVFSPGGIIAYKLSVKNNSNIDATTKVVVDLADTEFSKEIVDFSCSQLTKCDQKDLLKGIDLVLLANEEVEIRFKAALMKLELGQMSDLKVINTARLIVGNDSSCVTCEISVVEEFNFLDSDEDGVLDNLDYCLGTMPDVSVDINGCGIDQRFKISKSSDLPIINNLSKVKYLIEIENLVDYEQTVNVEDLFLDTEFEQADFSDVKIKNAVSSTGTDLKKGIKLVIAPKQKIEISQTVKLQDNVNSDGFVNNTVNLIQDDEIIAKASDMKAYEQIYPEYVIKKEIINKTSVIAGEKISYQIMVSNTKNTNGIVRLVDLLDDDEFKDAQITNLKCDNKKCDSKSLKDGINLTIKPYGNVKVTFDVTLADSVFNDISDYKLTNTATLVVDDLATCLVSCNDTIEIEFDFSDIDNDGVLDNIDVCPQTKEGELVDINGCAIDQRINFEVTADVDEVSNASNYSYQVVVENLVDYEQTFELNYDFSDVEFKDSKIDIVNSKTRNQVIDLLPNGELTSIINVQLGQSVINDTDNLISAKFMLLEQDQVVATREQLTQYTSKIPKFEFKKNVDLGQVSFGSELVYEIMIKNTSDIDGRVKLSDLLGDSEFVDAEILNVTCSITCEDANIDNLILNVAKNETVIVTLKLRLSDEISVTSSDGILVNTATLEILDGGVCEGGQPVCTASAQSDFVIVKSDASVVPVVEKQLIKTGFSEYFYMAFIVVLMLMWVKIRLFR